ncbi:hypothetical protein [Taibaiella sp. KBW10]|uniref:hypothetical protein n=1 Tax=Taibaiella sp. KBW10 TaxID=2153357 RepID=UPI000F5A21FA|nr:hypothetical protein [Taibaiella sp. KBW10]
MKTIFKTQIIALLSLFCNNYSMYAQKDSLGRTYKEEYFYSSTDSVKYSSNKLEVYHVLHRKMGLDKKVLFARDGIFADSFNNFSLLYITNKSSYKSIVVPTIPIDNLIINDSNKLILGLSRAMESQYNIVLYDFAGRLLFKKNISNFELSLDAINFKLFKKLFPDYYSYANKNNQINFDNSRYFVDLDYWQLLSPKDQEIIKSKDWLKFSHDFPNLFKESFGSPPSYALTKYSNFYSLTDPFYEYEMSKSGTPVAIILNDVYGGKVRIPVFIRTVIEK